MRMVGNCLTWYLLSWFDIGLHMLQNRLQVVFIANTQIFNLDFPLLGPVFGDLRGIWNSYRKTNWVLPEGHPLQQSTFPLSPAWAPSFKPLGKWSPSSLPRGGWAGTCLAGAWLPYLHIQGERADTKASLGIATEGNQMSRECGVRAVLAWPWVSDQHRKGSLRKEIVTASQLRCWHYHSSCFILICKYTADFVSGLGSLAFQGSFLTYEPFLALQPLLK